jgi:hypothetical protein
MDGAMNGGIPIETIKYLTRKYLSNLEDIDIEIYDLTLSPLQVIYCIKGDSKLIYFFNSRTRILFRDKIEILD